MVGSVGVGEARGAGRWAVVGRGFEEEGGWGGAGTLLKSADQACTPRDGHGGITEGYQDAKATSQYRTRSWRPPSNEFVLDARPCYDGGILPSGSGHLANSCTSWRKLG